MIRSWSSPRFLFSDFHLRIERVGSRFSTVRPASLKEIVICFPTNDVDCSFLAPLAPPPPTTTGTITTTTKTKTKAIRMSVQRRQVARPWIHRKEFGGCGNKRAVVAADKWSPTRREGGRERGSGLTFTLRCRQDSSRPESNRMPSTFCSQPQTQGTIFQFQAFCVFLSQHLAFCTLHSGLKLH